MTKTKCVKCGGIGAYWVGPPGCLWQPGAGARRITCDACDGTGVTKQFRDDETVKLREKLRELGEEQKTTAATTLSDLADRLEAGERGREIDRKVALALGWHRVEPRFTKSKHGAWIAPGDFIGTYSDGSPKLDGLHGTDLWRDPPPVSDSIDASEKVKEERLPEWDWHIWRFADLCDAALFKDAEYHAGTAPNERLARLAAILRAVEKQGDGQ